MGDGGDNPVRSKSEFNSYGILLVSLSFVLRFIHNGIAQSVGLIIRALLDEFDVTKSEANGVGSVNTGVMLISGPVSGLVVEKLGSRVGVVTGGLLATLGLACSTFVPTFHVLYVTYGAITGFGFSLVSLSCMVPLNMYFHERRTLANGLSNIGGGLGSSGMPFLVAWLMEVYGWRGQYLILAGLCLQSVVVGMLYRQHRRNPKKNTLMKPNTEDEKSEGVLHKIKGLYTNKYFVMYGVVSFSVDTAIMVPFYMIPVIAASIGLVPSQQAMILTAAGITSTVIRPLISVLVDRFKSHTISIMGVAAILLGVATVGLVFLQNYPSYVAYGCILGITHGTYLLLKPIALIDIVGKESYALGLGFYRVFAGTAVLVGPLIAGWIMDIRGHFDGLCYYAVSVFSFGGVCLIVYNFFFQRRHIEETIDEYCVVSQTDMPGKSSDTSL